MCPMANISSASGTIHLTGRWTKAAVEALLPVLDTWKFYGEYGLQWYDTPSLQERTVDFSGCGRWSFSETLDSFHDWTCGLLKEKPQRNGQPICTLTEEAYQKFLQIMAERDLKLTFDFEDKEGGVGFRVHCVCKLSSDGERLHCKQTRFEGIRATSADMETAIDFFAQFLTHADREKLQEWIEDRIDFLDLFRTYALYEYDQFIYDFLEYMDDPFPDFCREFSPDTPAWKSLCEDYEDIVGNLPEDGD